jgi:hypothetical protein
VAEHAGGAHGRHARAELRASVLEDDAAGAKLEADVLRADARGWRTT